MPEQDDLGKFDAFVELIARLRAPDGCPWDREQTHQSLRENLLSETYEVLEALRRRAATQDVGVLLLTAKREEGDRIKGLSLGADDYLVKPFAPQELVLRVGAVLRRLAGAAVASGSKLVAGPLVIDRAGHRVAVQGSEIDLTPTEYKLLLTLAERRGRVQTRAQLLETVWEAHPDIQPRTVDMHMQRLRAKPGPAADWIETVRGFGYRFRAAEGAKARR